MQNHTTPANSNARLLKVVTKRVADKKIQDIFDGQPRTDGINVWLPLSTPDLSFDDKVGIASHEGAHIRFKTIFDSDIHHAVCPENPLVGHAVLNILEDSRVDALLKRVYFGFWLDLDSVNLKQGRISLQKHDGKGRELLYSQYTVDLCLYLMGLHASGHEELLYDGALKDPGGSFKYAAAPLGKFWSAYIEAKKKLDAELTFPSMVVAGKSVIAALKQLINDLDAQSNEGKPAGADACGERGNHDELPEQAFQDRPDANRLATSQRQPMAPRAGRGNGHPGDHHAENDIGHQGGHALNRDLAGQVISQAPAGSGIKFADADKNDKKMLEKVKNKLLASKDNLDKFRKAVASLSKKEMKRIDALLREDAVEDRGEDDGRDESIEVRDVEDGIEIAVDVIDDMARLREMNGIENPLKEYNDITRENHFTITKLRKTLSQIKVNPLMSRGSRKGLVCHRDLPRVISSQGKFNRPFMTPAQHAGASLLIVIDESASMSNEEASRSFFIDSECDECPRAGGCPVLSGCDEAGCCDMAGIWPKERDVGCERLQDCPLHEHLGTASNADLHDPAKTLPIYIAKKSAIVLAEALKETRIDFGVIGFSAVGGKHVIVEKVYKTFTEDVNPRKLGSIWVSFESGENRDGTSFRNIARRHFKGIQNRHPVMVVISDGEPHHGGTSYVEEVAEELTLEAVKELKQTVHMFAISIDYNGREYLKQIYGRDNYILLNDPREITDKLIYLVKNLAASLA